MNCRECGRWKLWVFTFLDLQEVLPQRFPIPAKRAPPLLLQRKLPDSTLAGVLFDVSSPIIPASLVLLPLHLHDHDDRSAPCYCSGSCGPIRIGRPPARHSSHRTSHTARGRPFLAARRVEPAFGNL